MRRVAGGAAIDDPSPPSRLSATSAGLGLPTRNPWAISHPISWSIGHLALCLDPLGDDGQREGLADAEDRLQQLAASAAVAQRRDEALVDLEDVDGQALQM